MSRDWNVHCVTCGVTHGFCDANHGLDLMRQIIRMRGVLERLGVEEHLFEYPLELIVETPYGRVDVAWFARHAGHTLVPIDEYGHKDGDCGMRYLCPCCSTAQSCRLPAGHTGNHSTAKPEEKRPA